MKIGDKIVCDNKHTYTIGKGNDIYNVSLIDEFGETVTLLTDYYLEDCMPCCGEDQQSLCIGYGYDGCLKYVIVLELIEV